MRNTAPTDAAQLEALETREWLESLDYVIKSGGAVRVSKLLRELSDHARRNGVVLCAHISDDTVQRLQAARVGRQNGSCQRV